MVKGAIWFNLMLSGLILGFRAPLDLKSLVSVENHRRIMRFAYIKSHKELDNFTVFVKNLKLKKIQGNEIIITVIPRMLKILCSSDWWTHKIQSEWILPCILKSKTFILLEHWVSHLQQQILAKCNITGPTSKVGSIYCLLK
jgi:hypothetical protein